MRWDKRLMMPKSEGGATICEKHDFIAEHFRDPDMSWEVDQAVAQAKDDGKRIEARLQELGEEANNLEEALQQMEYARDRLQTERDALAKELEETKYDLAKFQRSERAVVEVLAETTLKLEATQKELERVKRLLAISLPHVEASAGAEHMFDGFRPQRRPLDGTVEKIRAALAKHEHGGKT